MPRVVRILRALHAGYNAARAVHPPPPPPTPHFGAGPVARLARAALVAGSLALLLVALDAPSVLPASWTAYYRVASAAVLLPVGLWLTLRARRTRVVHGFGARMRERLLELGGVVMIAVGAVELILGLRHLL